MRWLPLLAVLSVAMSTADGIAQGKPIKFARGPHVADDGRIAFSYRGGRTGGTS